MRRWLPLLVACVSACRSGGAARPGAPGKPQTGGACPAAVVASHTEVDLPPGARASLRDGSALRLVGRGAEGEILVEVGSHIRLRGILGNLFGAEVAFATETKLAPGVLAAPGARATLLWYHGERLLIEVVNGEEYETTCDALATVLPAELREDGTAVTHITRAVTVLLDERGRRLAELPEGYPVVSDGSSESIDHVAVTVRFAGYTFRGVLPRDALSPARTYPDWTGGWNSSPVREIRPFSASCPCGDPCSGTASLRAGAVVSDGARVLLATTKEHSVALEATRGNERLVALTDLDPAITELLAWVDASDLSPSACGPAPPTK